MSISFMASLNISLSKSNFTKSAVGLSSVQAVVGVFLSGALTSSVLVTCIDW